MVAERDFLLEIKLCRLNQLTKNNKLSYQMNVFLAQPIIEIKDYTALNTIQNIVLLQKGLAHFNKKLSANC